MEDVDQPRPRQRWPRVLLAVLVVLAVALAGLWLARKPIAGRYADRFLAEKGVPARYEIADLGFGRQRLVNVVLGDPRDPDLVADWLEARTAIGLNGPYLTGVRGGRVRVKARFRDGKLSLGSIDRLLPPPSGEAFALPALQLDVADLRARVETPWGLVGAKLTGRGRLDDGFDGRLAMTAARMGGACGAERPGAVTRVTTMPGRVRLEGSAEAAGLACAGAATGYAQVSGRGEIRFGRVPGWSLETDVAAQTPRHAAARAARMAGRVTLSGSDGLRGDVALTADRVVAPQAMARAATVAGTVAFAGDAFTYTGKASGRGVALRASLPGVAALAGTPLEPVARQLRGATARAVTDFDVDTTVGISTAAGLWVGVDTVSVRSASGARADLVRDDRDVALGWRASPDRLLLDGILTIAGGGLPTVRARLDQAAAGLPVRGTATVAEYRAGDASVALAPVTFSVAPSGAVQVRTTATVSGPLADGRVDGLRVPIDLVQSAGGVLLNRSCTPVSWGRVAVSGLVLDSATVRLCPTGGALLAFDGGGLSGGASLGATRLTGRLGSTPVALTAAGTRLRLGERGFTLEGVQARLGQPGRETRIDVASLEGRATPQGIAGRFSGAGGQVGAVPLLMSDAAGDWRFAGGTLALTGGLTVSDAQTDRPRLRPMPVRDIALTLRGSLIEASGRVLAPTDGRLVTTLQLTHDLTRGAGGVRLAVPGLVFDDGLQPDQLTPVTFGVVADVKGTVTGEGQIDWTPEGVTSSGTARTADADLAAAFGPVEGIAGEIRFTDLLALQSAPGQVLTVRSVNPGIPVTDGTVRLQTLANARVQVEGARWPFAGGTLTLEPTLLDFTASAQRRMTFRIEGMAADRFLQQFDFKNLDATGIFDGVLPMVFDAGGGRIENGRLTVRPGGGTIAYVGDITQKDIGFWPNLAFQALKSLRYRSLNIVMNGPLAGEMVTEVRFAGISQGQGAARGGITGLLVGRLQRLPFVFNIRIKAPFRGLLDATASYYDPSRLIQRNLPQLLEEQEKRERAPAPPALPSPIPVAPPSTAPPSSPAQAGAQVP